MGESNHDSSVLSPSTGFESPLPQESRSQLDLVAKLESQISSLTQQNAVLRGDEEYVLRELSRNGQGIISNIETVTDQAVRQREQLRVENEELCAEVQRLESSVTYLQGIIAHPEDELKRAVWDLGRWSKVDIVGLLGCGCWPEDSPGNCARRSQRLRI